MNKMSVKEEIDSLKEDVSILTARFSTLHAALLANKLINYYDFEKDSQETLAWNNQIEEACELACKSKLTYTDIKSIFVKNELKKTSLIDSMYIDDLMHLELLVSGKTFGLPTGNIREYLKLKYPDQWKAIFLELNPKGYKKELALDQKKEKKRQRLEEKYAGAEEMRKERQKRIEAWKRAGGRL